MVVQSIEITDISVRFKDEQVLNRISFVLKSGNITALIGPNGAGKSTCMKVLAGLVYPQSGSFSINNSSSNNVFSDLRKYGGFLIESPAFYSYMSAHQNLKLLQKIRPLKRPVEELLKLVGLENTSSKKLAHFSKGMKQRLGIAQALIGDPDFLVLDEPFHGLDIEVKEELMEIIEKLAKEEGKSILISSHLLSDLEKIADDFVLLNKGKLHFYGKMGGFQNEKFHVKFGFNTAVVSKLLTDLEINQIHSQSEKTFSLTISENERQLLLKKMINKGFIPVSIDAASVLTQKYREISL